jgi:hypothetical protein
MTEWEYEKIGIGWDWIGRKPAMLKEITSYRIELYPGR